jgi:nucleolar protein 53
MGKKAKTSRKGKKAWRANISTEDIDNFFEKSTKDALTGGSLAHVETDSLFFVDKSKGSLFILLRDLITRLIA